MKVGVSKVDVLKWRKEVDNYLVPGDDGYIKQAIETDAIKFAEKLYLDLYGDE